MKSLTFLLTTFLLFSIYSNYSFIPRAGPSTGFRYLEIVPENDSVVQSNDNVSYYKLNCDRTKINLANNAVISTTKAIISERLTFPNLRRTYNVEFPGADARYDYLCWTITVGKDGSETASIKKILKVGEPPSEVSQLTPEYVETIDSTDPNNPVTVTNTFRVKYSLPDKNGSSLNYIDTYLKTKEGSYKRLCNKVKPITDTDDFKSCSVNSKLLLDSPFNLSSGDVTSVYVISENAFGKSKITYSSDITVLAPPSTPLLPPAEVSYLTSESQIVITITPVAGAVNYELWYLKGNTGSYVRFITQTSTTFNFNKFNLAIGDVYNFYYLARNNFSQSQKSPVTSITIATAPDRMYPPILSYSVENSGSVKITMISGKSNGSPITSYHLKIKSVQGDLVELPWCDSTEVECFYPGYVFKDSPFYLETGQLIYASSANSNIKGISAYSDLSNGLSLKGSPKQPPTPPYSGASTNQYQISVKIDALTETYADEEKILSYNVVVMFGENNYISLIGGDNQSAFTDLNREILFYDVEMGQTYRFLYRAKNSFGWGEFSEIGYITVPSS